MSAAVGLWAVITPVKSDRCDHRHARNDCTRPSDCRYRWRPTGIPALL